MQVNARDHMAMYNIAVVYTEIGMLEEAEESLVALLRLAPDEPNAKKKLAKVRKLIEEKEKEKH